MAENLRIPDHSLVFLYGPSGSGKTTFARRHFPASRIISSDECRVMVADTCEGEQFFNDRAFGLLFAWLNRRLELGRFTVLDSTALSPHAREQIRKHAARWHVPVYPLVLNVPREVCHARNDSRERKVPREVVEDQYRRYLEGLEALKEEGYPKIFSLNLEEIDAVQVRVVPTRVESDDSGPFDIVGGLYGCHRELILLLEELGYRLHGEEPEHPEGRKLILIGDLAGPGPASAEVWDTYLQFRKAGLALMVPGPGDLSLRCLLAGATAMGNPLLKEVVTDLESRSTPDGGNLANRVLDELNALPPYRVLDSGKLSVSYAGTKRYMIGRTTLPVIRFCVYGEDDREKITSSEARWWREYDGPAYVVFNYPGVKSWRTGYRVINLNHRCASGGSLAGFRYPEMEMVRVQAERQDS